MLDEAGLLFASLKRDYNAGLLGLMLKLYDAPNELTHETVGHGRTTVRQAILSFFGATTPDNIEDHLRNKKLWGEGLWSRFALLVPQGSPEWAFFPRELEYPAALVSSLRRVAGLFMTPEARLVEESGRSNVEVYNVPPPSSVSIVPEGLAAWESYTRATGHYLLDNGVDETLHGSYARLAAHMIKVAMILATLDAERLPVRIELHHLARAQQIVERWREDLHRIWNDGIETEETRLADRVMAALGRAQPGVRWMLASLCRRRSSASRQRWLLPPMPLLWRAGSKRGLWWRSCGSATRSNLHGLRFRDQGWASKLEQTLAQLRRLSVGDHDQWLTRQIRSSSATIGSPWALALRLLIAAWRAEALDELGDEEAAALARAEAEAVAQAARCRRKVTGRREQGIDVTVRFRPYTIGDNRGGRPLREEAA